MRAVVICYEDDYPGSFRYKALPFITKLCVSTTPLYWLKIPKFQQASQITSDFHDCLYSCDNELLLSISMFSLCKNFQAMMVI